MELSRPGAFVKQIAIYLAKGDGQPAYDTSRDFVTKFPKESMSHLLLAHSAFRLGRFNVSKTEGILAFNLSSTRQDMLTCAVIAGMAYNALKDYSGGYKMLSVMEKTLTSAELEKLLIIFALMMNDPASAARHQEILFKINAKIGEDFFLRILGGSGPS